MYKHWFTYNSIKNFISEITFENTYISKFEKKEETSTFGIFMFPISHISFYGICGHLSNKDLYKLPVELLFVLHFLKQVPDAVQNVDLRVRCSTKPFPQKWQEEFNQWQASWLVSHKLADSENFKHERIQSKFLLNKWVQVWLIFRSWYFISCIWINGDWKS